MSEALSSAIEKLKGHPQFASVLEYAKGVAKLNGHEELSPSHIAMGAWLAWENGQLQGVLKEHLSLYRAKLSRFVEMTKWNKDGAERVESETRTSPTLKVAIAHAAQTPDALLTLVDLGLTEVEGTVDKERTAIHEAGHAVISLALRPEVRISTLSIVSEGDSGGRVGFYMRRPRSLEEVVEEICVGLAGRVAQVKKFGTDAADAGASADMASATLTALNAVMRFGLDEEFGMISMDAVAKFMGELAGSDTPLPKGFLFDEAQRRVQVLLKNSYKRTQQLVNDNWDAIEQVAALALEKGTLTEEEVRSVLPALKV